MVTLPYCLMLAEIKLPKRKTRPCHVIKIFMKRWLTDRADNFLERAPVFNPLVRLEDLELWSSISYVSRIVPRVKRSLLSRSGRNLDVFTYLSSTWTFRSQRFYDVTCAAGTRSRLCSSLNGSLKKNPARPVRAGALLPHIHPSHVMPHLVPHSL